MNTLSKDKTTDERAEDTAYTINHVIACTTTDLFAAPYISNLTYRHFGKRVNVGCGNHHHGFWHFLVGEFLGDIAAVPLTVAIEHHAPWLMQGLRRIMEPIAGPVFRASAKREAQAWAEHSGLALDSDEAKARQQAIYGYEMQHLPQAAVWTAASFVFNVAAQELLHRQLHKGHNHGPKSIWPLAGSVFTGKTVSTTLLVGLRALVPQKAHEWDSFAARKIFWPATRTVSNIFGVDTGTIDRAESKNEELENSKWEKRVTDREPVTDVGI